MTTHNTQEQDLRTALEEAERALRPFSDCAYNDNGDVSVSDIGRCGLPEFTAAYFAQRAALSALLAAPPRPVDADRVEVEAAAAEYDRWGTGYNSRRAPGHTSWVGRKNDDGSWHEVSSHGSENEAVSECHARALAAAMLAASPAHSPDKAVTREGVVELTENEIRSRAKALILEQGWKLCDKVHGQGVLELMTKFGKSLLVTPPQDRCAHPDCGCDADSVCSAALAPKPTGTEAGRGVIPAGWRLVPEEPTNAMCDVGAERVATGAQWLSARDAYRAMLAATPTPPVSPSPDSTGPAGADRELDISDVLSAARTMIDAAYQVCGTAPSEAQMCRLQTEADYLSVCVAALTPSAPIADTSPDSTGQGDAQTEAPVRENGVLVYDTDADGAWVWLVWALSSSGAHLAAIAQNEVRAEAYAEAVARLYPGARPYVERAPVNHSFGASDLRSVAYRAAMKDARRQRLPTPATVSQGDAQTQEGGR